jgi:hypothetical protein
MRATPPAKQHPPGQKKMANTPRGDVSRYRVQNPMFFATSSTTTRKKCSTCRATDSGLQGGAVRSDSDFRIIQPRPGHPEALSMVKLDASEAAAELWKNSTGRRPRNRKSAARPWTAVGYVGLRLLPFVTHAVILQFRGRKDQGGASQRSVTIRIGDDGGSFGTNLSSHYRPPGVRCHSWIKPKRPAPKGRRTILSDGINGAPHGKYRISAISC